MTYLNQLIATFKPLTTFGDDGMYCHLPVLTHLKLYHY